MASKLLHQNSHTVSADALLATVYARFDVTVVDLPLHLMVCTCTSFCQSM